MRRPRLSLALALGLLPALAARPAAAQPACTDVAGNLVQNCGFEGGTNTGTNGQSQPTGYTVTFNNGGFNASVSGSARNGANAYAFRDRSPGSTTLSQTLTTTVGTPYQISFFAENVLSANANNGLMVMFGDLLLRTGPLVNQTYQQFTYTGVATSTSTTLAFTGYNNDVFATVIDDLSVVALGAPTTTAPEPATWALCGAGLLAVGSVARRRRTQA